MNRLVSINQVGRMWLRIRDANTDIDFGVFSTDRSNINYNENKGCYIVIFNLTSIKQKLIISNYYKIQIAYEANSGMIGHYSTVAITKCTVMPETYIENLNINQVNNNIDQYIGVYSNAQDPSEKNYQYMFELSLIDGTILDSTNWCYHNSNNDTLSSESEDIYNLLYDLNNYNMIQIQYKVKTNNGLICESPKYNIQSTNGASPSLQAQLYTELDYNNGCVNLFLKPNNITVNISDLTNNPTTYIGKFILSRASKKNNYKIWIPIYRFELTGKLPKKLFTDFTCAHGEHYQYCIQQYNDNNVYSSKILSNKILVEFEHIFLYDGERQLKISFNPKINSYKTVFQESKKTTLGAQYPYFFRNGNIQYKEFSISGLISYLMDENQYFISRINDLNMPNDWQDTYNITDENITYERKFREAVLNWINNGRLKLFRSSTEGNYIVRLMNTSLTANDTVSRMIATFSTTATEAIEYNDNNLLEYEFFDNALHVINSGLFYYNINLNELVQKNSLNTIRSTDFLFGYKCIYLKVEDFNMLDPLNINLNGKTYIIGNNLNYEIKLESPQNNLYFTNLSSPVSGTITIGIQYSDLSIYTDFISSMDNSNITRSRSINGDNSNSNQLAYDLIESFNSYKQIDDLNYIGCNWISKYQGIVEEDFELLKGNAYNLNQLYQMPLSRLQVGDIYQVNNDYYQYVHNNSYNGPTSWNRYKKVNIKDEISKIYSIKFTRNNQIHKFNTLQDFQLQYNCILTKVNNEYLINFNSPNQYSDIFIPGAQFIISRHYENNQYQGELILSYNDNKLFIMPNYKFYHKDYGLVSLSENQIYIDGKVYSLLQDESLIINDLDHVPNIIQWGSAIKAYINYEIIQKIYTIDNKIKNAYNLYNYSKCCRAAQILKLKYFNYKPKDSIIAYYWNGINFELTDRDDLLEYWIPVSNDEYDLEDIIIINNESYTCNTLINSYIENRNNYFIQLNNNVAVAIENKIFEGNDYGIRII